MFVSVAVASWKFRLGHALIRGRRGGRHCRLLQPCQHGRNQPFLGDGPVEQSWREKSTAAKTERGTKKNTFGARPLARPCYLIMFRCVVSCRTPPRKFKICIPHAYCCHCCAIALACSVLRPRTRLQPSFA